MRQGWIFVNGIAAILFLAAAGVAHAQQTRPNTAMRAANHFPTPAAHPIRMKPLFAPAVKARILHPGTVPAVRPMHFTPVTTPRVRPITIVPVAMARPFVAAPVVRPIGFPQSTPMARFHMPPASGRLLPEAPPKPTPAMHLLRIRAVSQGSHAQAGSLPALPPGGKLYCSPTTVFYNTGSICFNPDLFTVDPAFYPWGLWSAPAYVNAPGFVPLFEPGLLIRYCPQCAFLAGSVPFATAGLSPPVLPANLWRNSEFHVTATRELPRVTAPRATPALGPPVILVLRNGSNVMVSRYWLGQDWLLHYVTVNGNRGAIPLGALNLESTGARNYARGVTFVLPGWPAPKAKN